MNPTKAMSDYMSEMNRLFSNTTENDIFQSPSSPSLSRFSSPFNQTSINRSSSSTDSTSPDSFPDLSTRLDYRQPDPALETPFMHRRQRPIVGRKIFETPAPVLEPTKPDDELSAIWQNDNHLLFQRKTPTYKMFSHQRNYTQSDLYQLFPSENKGYELTPVKNTTTYMASPVNTSQSFSPIPRSPNAPVFSTPFIPNPQNFGAGSSNYQDMNKMCTLCRKNGETPGVYMTHTVKEKIGNRSVVTCPILRSHQCPYCGATGDNAHTDTYCPVRRRANNGQPLQSTTITLKNTRIKSNGRRRF